MSTIYAEASAQWREMRQDYERYISTSYDAALELCSGVLINKEGRAAGIDGYDLFTGPLQRAQRYASEELINYWSKYPRLTLTDFEQQWVSGNLITRQTVDLTALLFRLDPTPERLTAWADTYAMLPEGEG
jgi:hypothetical protein